MSLEHILLGMLREPASGYDLRKSFESGARHIWSAELSQIYPTLKRMAARGWLTCDAAPSRRGPARREYARTKAGSAALESWLRAEPLAGQERIAYIAQLIFLGELDDAEATKIFLERLREQLRAKLALLEPVLTEFLNDADGDPNNLDSIAFHEYLSLRMGVAAYSARLRTCEENLVLLKSRKSGEVHHA